MLASTRRAYTSCQESSRPNAQVHALHERWGPGIGGRRWIARPRRGRGGGRRLGLTGPVSTSGREHERADLRSFTLDPATGAPSSLRACRPGLSPIGPLSGRCTPPPGFHFFAPPARRGGIGPSGGAGRPDPGRPSRGRPSAPASSTPEIRRARAEPGLGGDGVELDRLRQVRDRAAPVFLRES